MNYFAQVAVFVCVTQLIFVLLDLLLVDVQIVEAIKTIWTIQAPVSLKRNISDLSVYRDLDHPPKFDQFDYFWPPPDKFAYVWFADGTTEICSALLSLDHLQKDHPKTRDPSIDHVLLFARDEVSASGTSAIEEDLLDKWELMGGVSEEVTIKMAAVASSPILRRNRLQMHAFTLVEYHRILLLSADGSVVQNMDHMFQWEPQNIAQTVISAPISRSMPSQRRISAKPCFDKSFKHVQVSAKLLLFSPLESIRDRIAQHTKRFQELWSVEEAINYEFACNEELDLLPQSFMGDPNEMDWQTWDESRPYFVQLSPQQLKNHAQSPNACWS